MARRRSRGSNVSSRRSGRGRKTMNRSERRKVSRKRSKVSRKRSKVSRGGSRYDRAKAWRGGQRLIYQSVANPPGYKPVGSVPSNSTQLQEYIDNSPKAADAVGGGVYKGIQVLGRDVSVLNGWNEDYNRIRIRPNDPLYVRI